MKQKLVFRTHLCYCKEWYSHTHTNTININSYGKQTEKKNLNQIEIMNSHWSLLVPLSSEMDKNDGNKGLFLFRHSSFGLPAFVRIFEDTMVLGKWFLFSIDFLNGVPFHCLASFGEASKNGNKTAANHPTNLLSSFQFQWIISSAFVLFYLNCRSNGSTARSFVGSFKK